ncbi:hypothetical protein Y11_40651 [Yersinia enterocolitica subsp. palearctica Y11]|uniref:Uncharacterized protein n=2 Tax=Yersinia enterocolitica TaxID=630 RepID=A0A0H3NY46_YERE1|nr:unknown protein [Yersinia enterocolitica W22703]CBY28465.1 hypothetical protein Y11_40651 [Yersinia enterocolitica subsp. palearctica Y11]CCO70685.1 hypothetical protein D322_3833 [Yersinia enterocolitica IP 10393]
MDNPNKSRSLVQFTALTAGIFARFAVFCITLPHYLWIKTTLMDL